MMNALILLLVSAVYGPLAARCVAAIRHDQAAQNWDDIQNRPLLRWIYARGSREKYLREEKPLAWLGIGVLVPTWSLLVWFMLAGR